MENLHNKLHALQHSQDRIIPLLRDGASTPDWAPAEDRWSFRYIAAHLATTERECFLERVRLFQEKEQPHFHYYHNSERDFSGQDIDENIAAWKAARQKLIAGIQSLDDVQLANVAVHETRGEINIFGLLDLILDHDQVHQQELEENLMLRDQA